MTAPSQVGIGPIDSGGFSLQVSLDLHAPNISADDARELMERADQRCPSSTRRAATPPSFSPSTDTRSPDANEHRRGPAATAGATAGGTESRLLGIDRSRLARVWPRIGIAVGIRKTAAIVAAARSGLINVLVTDIVTASALMARVDGHAPVPDDARNEER